MIRTVFYNAKILDPEKPDAPRAASALWICDGRIEQIGSFDADATTPQTADRSQDQTCISASELVSIDLQGAYLAPGFIDLHYHGSLIFADAKDLVAKLRASSARLVQEGVTAFLPTTVASSQARLEEILEVLAPVFEGNSSPPGSLPRERTERTGSTCAAGGGAEPLGLHLEGPWINAACAGAQPKAAIRAYDAAQGEAIFSRYGNSIRMVTLAPEIPGAASLLEELSKRGIVAALGHSQAGAEETEAAIQLGARHVTHLFNAMQPLHHRDPGLLGVALSDGRLSCDLICDGVHLDPRIVRLAALAKRERLVLITDRIELAGSHEKDSYGFGALHDDGTALRLSDGRLAGSSLGMDRAFRNVQSFGAMTRLEAVAACTLRPAQLLGIEAERGTLRLGARADFAILDAAGEVLQTWIAGEPVFQRK